MQRNVVILLGTALFLALFLLCVRHATPRVEADLSKRADDALDAVGLESIHVDFEGRDARLTGTVSETQIKELADATVRTVRGIRTVDNAVVVDEGATGRRDATDGQRVVLGWAGDRMTVSGGVPSEAARSAIVTVASSVFGAARVQDELKIVPGSREVAASEAGAVATLLVQLAEGEARFIDGAVTVDGWAATESVREEVLVGIGAHWESAEATIQVGSPPEAATESTPPSRAAPLDSADCQRELDRWLASERIRFAKNSAEIDPSSLGLLDGLTDVALRCQDARLEVSGHTDSYGPADWNTELSQLRADAVAGYLIRGGVEARRLQPRGYGSERPLADNETQAGREENRRIEFEVLESR